MDENKDHRPSWVVLLGAGASVEAGYPLYNEITSEKGLRSRFSKLISNELSAIAKEVGEAFAGLEFMKSSKVVNSSKQEFEGLYEKCAQISNSGLHFELYLKEIQDREPEKLESALTYYHKLLTIPEYHIKTSQADYLNVFLRLPHLVAPIKKLVVISLNHDMLVERLLGWNFHYKGFEEMTFRSCSISQNAKAPLTLGEKHLDQGVETGVELIKLHGSLNWIECKHCGHVVYSNVPIHLSSNDFGWVFNHVHPCPKCLTKKPWKTTLIPPLAGKQPHESNPFWQSALSAIKEAEIISLAGYSFPDYDQHTWQLIEAIEACKILDHIEPFPSKTSAKIQQVLERKGAVYNLHKKTLKKFARDLIIEAYQFDPFPADCDEYRGPSRLFPVW